MNMNAFTVDRLYLGLGFFTNLYLALIAIEFFSNLHLTHPALELMLDALSEPYLGALAVYVVLKEIRKRRPEGAGTSHHGERFVIAWLVFLGLTTLAVVFTERYRFDLVYGLIISNAAASAMLYLGSHIHKP